MFETAEHLDRWCSISSKCSACFLQVKDEVNAGSLQFKLGRVEFDSVHFSYTNGFVHIYFHFSVKLSTKSKNTKGF